MQTARALRELQRAGLAGSRRLLVPSAILGGRFDLLIDAGEAKKINILRTHKPTHNVSSESSNRLVTVTTGVKCVFDQVTHEVKTGVSIVAFFKSLLHNIELAL